MSRKITVDLDDLHKLAFDSGDIALDPEAERSLISLLELQQAIEIAISEAKTAIKEKALSYNPNFTKVVASRVSVNYQASGSIYGLDEKQIAKPDQLIITVTAPGAHKADSDDALKKMIADQLEYSDDLITIDRVKGNKGKLDPELYTATIPAVKYSPIAKAITKAIKDSGKLPVGVIELERNKNNIVLKLKNTHSAIISADEVANFSHPDAQGDDSSMYAEGE